MNRDEVLDLARRNDFAGLALRGQAWISDPTQSEEGLAWFFGVCFEVGAEQALALIPEFLVRFPRSVFPPRVFLADRHARLNKFDEATDLARQHLRLLEDSGILRAASHGPIFADAISRAFVLLTAAYVEVGARGYARRVLERASRVALPADFQKLPLSQLALIERELEDDATQSLNRSWETFFQGGKLGQELFDRCREKGFERLAERISLIETHFKFDERWRADEKEMLALVVRLPGGQITLQ